MKVRFDERELDTSAHLLRHGEREIPLTPKAFQLLELLVEKRPEAVSKAQIHTRLWPRTFVAEVNLATLVYELRRALGDDARKPRWLRTVRGFGYALAASDVAEESPEPLPGDTTARLVWRDRVIRLAWGENLLGRSAESVALIDESGVSRRHATLTLEPGSAILVDCGSKNGTLLNGRRIDAPEALSDRDEIRLGQARLVYREVASMATETV